MSLVDHIGVFHSYQNLLGNVLHIKRKQTMLVALAHSHHKLHLVFSSSQSVRYCRTLSPPFGKVLALVQGREKSILFFSLKVRV